MWLLQRQCRYTHTQRHTISKPNTFTHSLNHSLTHPPTHSLTSTLFLWMMEGGFGPMEGCKRQISIRPFKRAQWHQNRPNINEMAAFQSLASSKSSKGQMYGSTSKFGDGAPQAWLLSIQYRYTHEQTHTNTKLKSLTHTITQPSTHPHIH